MAAGAKALGTERRESPVFPPVRACVPDDWTEEGPAPPSGFEANLGRFQGASKGRRKKQDKSLVSSGQPQLPAVRAVTGVCAG